MGVIAGGRTLMASPTYISATCIVRYIRGMRVVAGGSLCGHFTHAAMQKFIAHKRRVGVSSGKGRGSLLVAERWWLPPIYINATCIVR